MLVVKAFYILELRKLPRYWCGPDPNYTLRLCFSCSPYRPGPGGAAMNTKVTGHQQVKVESSLHSLNSGPSLPPPSLQSIGIGGSSRVTQIMEESVFVSVPSVL